MKTVTALELMTWLTKVIDKVGPDAPVRLCVETSVGEFDFYCTDHAIDKESVILIREKS